jgi:hypothetical protein
MSIQAGSCPKGPNDQKTLNEELIAGVVEVAHRNPQHAVELFGVTLGVAMRLASMSESQLDDLATTPVALWRPALSEHVVRRLPERRPLLTPAFEPYRGVIGRINRLALATFVRYADDPVHAALVCDLRDAGVILALQELPAFAFIEWGDNAGAPLIHPILSESVIDRLLRGDDDPVEPGLRGLLALAQAGDCDFARLRRDAEEDRLEHAAAGESARAALCKRAGRPASNFLMPATSSLILLMLRHQMRPTEVEDRLLARSDVRAAQLRGIAETLNPRPKRERGAPRDRSRDHRDLWGSAHRRLTATAIYRLHRRLVDAGVEAFEAMVRAYDYYANTYDADCGVSLSRMLKDVFSAMRQGHETHLSHCPKCGVVHLSHEEKTGIIECPVCVLARAGRFGQRRARTDRIELPAGRLFGAWPGGTAWPATGAAEQPTPA